MSSGVLEIGVCQHFNTLGMGAIRIQLTPLRSLWGRLFARDAPKMYIEAIGRFQSGYQVSVVGSVSINYAERQLMSSIISDICGDAQGYSVRTASPTPIDATLTFASFSSC
jgi:hypothetical protein